MTTKIEHINSAYSELRISGITVNPSPESYTLALGRLEDMMAELEDNKNICIGYNFENNPDPNTESGIGRADNHFVATNLAMRLVPDFNKQPSPVLVAQANQSYSSVSARVAASNIKQVQPSTRMPKGSGNRFNRYNKFSHPEDLPPNDCDTKKMAKGDINDFTESFADYLIDDVISSFTITPTAGLTIASSTNSTPSIDYRVQASSSSIDAYQTVTIVVTTDSGRVSTRVIDFEVS